MIGRDLALISFPNVKYKVPGGMISVLASYPVSFIMTEKSVENEALGLDDLFTYCTDEVDEIVELKCKTITAFYPQTYEYKHPYWPINISDDERGIPGVLAGTSSEDVIFAVPSDS